MSVNESLVFFHELTIKTQTYNLTRLLVYTVYPVLRCVLCSVLCIFTVGDKIPADMRIFNIMSTTLRIDQAILTGEYDMLCGSSLLHLAH